MGPVGKITRRLTWVGIGRMSLMNYSRGAREGPSRTEAWDQLMHLTVVQGQPFRFLSGGSRGLILLEQQARGNLGNRVVNGPDQDNSKMRTRGEITG